MVRRVATPDAVSQVWFLLFPLLEALEFSSDVCPEEVEIIMINPALTGPLSVFSPLTHSDL